MSAVRTRFRVTGTVQGVGFRPFVYRRASELGLDGFVRNDSDGVVIEAEGPSEGVDRLAQALRAEAPVLARVERIATEPLVAVGARAGFRIDASTPGRGPTVPVAIDSAPCAACLREVLDPSDRRHRYPFTTCTDCGPRYTIVTGVPYDRAATTMASFTMCSACQAEHDDPTDRRFHAQPNACAVCGPHVWWCDADGRSGVTGDDAVGVAIEVLRAGGIVAVKGIGGFHLAVDATSTVAVAELRRRKARDTKPFAVMVPDLATARVLCDLDETAAVLLSSPRRPIVLTPRRAGAPIADGVAPGLPDLGLLLPYSPLHHLLLEGVGGPLVMTSGNRSDEPIAHDDDDAIARLGPLVDGLLLHDRPIHIRADDSVARATNGRIQVLRRSRGYVPEPIALPFDTGDAAVLAVGAELKSTISVTRGRTVVTSHHLGDLEHLATYEAFRQAVEHLPRLSGVEPAIVAHDLHPELLSTKHALDLDLPAIGVQHHHAHAAAAMVEHGRTAPVVALCFDGLGYGTDGTLWGGEVLVADLAGFERAGHLRPVVMPGGVAAIREPWRMAAAWLADAQGPAVASDRVSSIDERAGAVVDLVERGHGPVTTSIGRLFDAVAALLGFPPRAAYEAHAVIEMEAAARRVARADAPRYDGATVLHDRDGILVVDPRALLVALAADLDAGVDRAVLAAGFHEAIGTAAAAMAACIADRTGIDTVALTGGVFQNVRLTEVVEDELHHQELHVLVHQQVPANDGGISIGQAAIAAWQSVHAASAAPRYNDAGGSP